MSTTKLCAFLIALLVAPAIVVAQTRAPWVSLRVTTPDGETLDRTARDGQVASVTFRNGTTYELRPTIQDERLSEVTIAILKAATVTGPTVVVGEVRVTTGGAAVDSKTTPNFKIAVPRIDAVG